MNEKHYLTSKISLHFRLLSLISIVFVVYIHATTVEFSQSLKYDSLIGGVQGLVSHNILFASLPVFFLIASFFLFSGVRDLPSLFCKIRKRVISLLMPYLAWAALWLFLVIVIRELTGLQVVQLDRPFLWYLFLDPLPGQLWFLRDLIFLVALSPLIFLIPSRVLVVLAISVFTWWLFVRTATVLEIRQEWYEVISNEALAWFLIGAVAARNSTLVYKALEQGGSYLILFLLAVLWFLGSYLPLPGQSALGISVIAGVLFLFFSINILSSIASYPFVRNLGTYSFLIYFGHHPLLGKLESLLISLAPDSTILHITVYLFAPLLIIGLIVVFFNLLYKVSRPIVFVLNGGRDLIPLNAL